MNIQTIRDKDGLDNLIEKFCPNGVDYKTLGEIAQISRGGSLQKKDFVESGVPCIHYGQIYTRYNLFADKTLSFISEECARKQKMAKQNDIIMAVTSENLDDVCKCVAWLGNEDVAVSGHSAIIRHNQNAKYLTYFFQTEMFASQKRKLAHGTKVIEVTPDRLKIIKLPLPPLPIQQEIVRILDTFTNLTAELTAELTARRKQYEYYRDELLTFGEDVPVTTFGEVSTIFRGASPRPIKDYITDDIDGINWIKIGDARPGTKYITDTAEKITKEGAKKSRFVYKGDFILSNSMSFGRPYIIKKTGCIHDGWLSISEFEEHYSTDFLYHLLSSHKYQSIMKRKASFGGAVQNLNADIVKSLELPIISLNEQRRIVSMLDKFDVICSDICAGLPAEIEARQRQYEYYRDKLLNFKKLHNKED